MELLKALINSTKSVAKAVIADTKTAVEKINEVRYARACKLVESYQEKKNQQ